jgi:hypothetical protein
MKQLKASWLMALALVIAVASAFATTSRATKMRVDELWYANDVHNTGNPLTSGQVDASVSYTDAQLTPAFLAAHCPPPTNIICLAKFQQGPTGSQIDFKSGRYQ